MRFYFDLTILFQPARIPFPEIDRGQYIEGWPAGWGAKEIMETARERSHKKPVTILAEGNFGMAGDVLVVYSHRGDFPTDWPIKLIQKYDKPCERNVLLPFDKLLGRDPATKECGTALYLFQLKQSS